jgi:hypothetical protein
MSDNSHDFINRVGLHILLVTMAAHVLRGESPVSITDVDGTLAYFRQQRPGTINLLLHEEPLYIAGHMLGLSDQTVDHLPIDTIATYHELYKQITERTRGRRRDYLKKIWPSLNELALREHLSTENYELQIVEPPGSTPTGNDRSTRRARQRK